MVRRGYAQLGTMRDRPEVVEYRVAQHLPKGQGRGKNIPATPKYRRGKIFPVGPARLERATSCSGGKRSIQLSYGPGKPPAKSAEF